MPLGDGQAAQMFPAQINVPTANGLFVSAQVQSDGTAEADAVQVALLSLVDYLQAWPGRHPGADVTGQFYDVTLYPATPTNPVPLPDPPLPEDEEASPSEVV